LLDDKVADAEIRAARRRRDWADGVRRSVPSGRSFAWARFCQAYAPTGTVIDIECAPCGDGPLVLLGETFAGNADRRTRVETGGRLSA
jgi:hypothetical protein